MSRRGGLTDYQCWYVNYVWHSSEKQSTSSSASRLTFDIKIRDPEVMDHGGEEWLDGQAYSIYSDRYFWFKGSFQC